MLIAHWDLASFLRHAVSSLLLPPGLFFSLLALGLSLRMWSRFKHQGLITPLYAQLSRSLWALSLTLALALSMPLVGGSLVRWVEGLGGLALSPAALTTKDPGLKADAVVVLSAGLYEARPEWPEGLVPKPGFLQRLIYAERLAQAQGLRLVIAGKGPIAGVNEAAFAKAFLLQTASDKPKLIGQSHNGIPSIHTESVSSNTEEAPRALQAMVARGELEPLKRIILVTSATHMLRAAAMFQGAGFEVIAAPTAYQGHYQASALDLLPSASQLAASAEAMHALLGEGWRRLKGP